MKFWDSPPVLFAGISSFRLQRKRFLQEPSRAVCISDISQIFQPFRPVPSGCGRIGRKHGLAFDELSRKRTKREVCILASDRKRNNDPSQICCEMPILARIRQKHILGVTSFWHADCSSLSLSEKDVPFWRGRSVIAISSPPISFANPSRYTQYGVSIHGRNQRKVQS